MREQLSNNIRTVPQSSSCACQWLSQISVSDRRLSRHMYKGLLNYRTGERRNNAGRKMEPSEREVPKHPEIILNDHGTRDGPRHDRSQKELRPFSHTTFELSPRSGIDCIYWGERDCAVTNEFEKEKTTSKKKKTRKEKDSLRNNKNAGMYRTLREATEERMLLQVRSFQRANV